MLNVPVMSLQTGKQLATISRPIIDPNTLKIVAWFVSGPMLDHDPAVIFSDDLRELGHLGAIVDSADNIMSPVGLVRLQKVLELGFELLGLKVVDDKKHRLGAVESFNFDSETFDIQQILVKPGLGKRLLVSHLMIARSQIKELNNQEMVVDSADTKVPTLKTVALDAQKQIPFENPFREQPRPAPETKRV
jgi:sporulation protein YlmC with PRC-barrel domain